MRFYMNKLPKFGWYKGQWVYDRIIPVHCPNLIPVSKRDPELLDKMFQERDGIFNKAVRAFKTVIENNYTFHEPIEVIDIKKQYRIDNNTALEFFNTLMGKRTEEIGRNDASTIDAIYKAYVDWYFEQSYKSNYRKEFFNDIADFLGEDYETMKKNAPAPHEWKINKSYKLKPQKLSYHF